jgi:hypothetical protein
MASKKTGRAAGLAALAGLAYMASRDKGGKETPSDSSYDTLESKRMPAKQEAATDSGDFLSRRLKTNQETGETYTTDNLTPMSSGRSAPSSAAKAPSASESSSSSRFAPSGSPVLSDNPRKIGNAKAVVAEGGNRSTRSDMQGSGGGRGPAIGEEQRYRMDRAFEAPSEADIQKGLEVGVGGPSLRALNAAAKGLANRGKSYTTKEGLKEIGYDAPRIGTEPLKLGMKKGGAVKKMASGGMTSSASKRGDGIASKGKTRCKMY